MMDDADLPGVGNIVERIADDVRTEAATDGEQLVVACASPPRRRTWASATRS